MIHNICENSIRNFEMQLLKTRNARLCRHDLNLNWTLNWVQKEPGFNPAARMARSEMWPWGAVLTTFDRRRDRPEAKTTILLDWSDSRKGSLEIIRNTLGHLGSAFWTAFNLSLGTQTVENCGNSINPRISRAKRSSFPNSAPMGRYTDRDAISKAGDWVNWVVWRNMTTVVPRILRLGVWRVCVSVLSTKIRNYNGTWQYKSYFLKCKWSEARNGPAKVPLASIRFGNIEIHHLVPPSCQFLRLKLC